MTLWFWLALPLLWVISYTFYCICWLTTCFLWKNVYSLPHFKLFGSFFAIEFYEFLITFGYLPLIRYMVCKDFLPICRLPLHFVGCVLCWADMFKFDYLNLFTFKACFFFLKLKFDFLSLFTFAFISCVFSVILKIRKTNYWQDQH